MPNIMTTTTSCFGTRLELWAQGQGLNLAQLAEILDVSKAGLYRYPKDPSLTPKTLLLLKLHEHWPTLNLDWLLTGEGDQELKETVEEEPNEKSHYERSHEFTQRGQDLLNAFMGSNEAAQAMLRVPVQKLLVEVLHDTEKVLALVSEGERGIRSVADSLEDDLLR